MCDKDREISGLFTEDRIYQASDISHHVLMVHGQSWQILWCLWWLSKPCCARALWTRRVPPVSHSCLCCPCSAFSVALLKGTLKCRCTLNLVEATPWEAIFLGHSLKAAGRLLRVTCWVNKFLPSWTTLSIWGDIKVHLPHQRLQAQLWHGPIYAARSSHGSWHVKSDFVNVAPP